MKASKTLIYEDTSEQPSTHDDVASNPPRTITMRHQAAWQLWILAQRTMASHIEKVREKVELYDFK